MARTSTVPGDRRSGDRTVLEWLRILRDGWPALVLFVALGVALSYGLTARQPTEYSARGRIVVSGSGFLSTENVDALPNVVSTVAALLESVEVLTAVRERYIALAPNAQAAASRRQVATLPWLRSRLEADVVEGTSVVEVSATDSRQSSAHDLTAAGVDGLTSVVRAQVEESAPGLPASVSAAKVVVFTRSEDRGRVSPTPRTNRILGWGSGLLLGLAAGVGLGLLRRRLGSPSEIAAAIGAPLLGVTRRRTRLDATDAGIAEVRARLEENAAAGNGAIVLLTGPVTARQLAALGTALVESLCGAQATAVLVDADFAGRSASTLLGVTGVAGLRESLDGDGAGASATFVRDAMAARAPRVPVLPAGAPSDDDHASSVSSTALREALSVLHAHYRYVIVTGPGTARRAEVISLLGAVDAAIVVIERGASGHHVDSTLDLGAPLASRAIGTLVLE